MNEILVPYKKPNGVRELLPIESTSIACPFCNVVMVPSFLHSTYYNPDGSHEVFCECTNPNCKTTFVSVFNTRGRGISKFEKIHPNPPLLKKEFSKTIGKISPSFKEIYNQAYSAFQMNLTHICGMGFRKALEFLIKDYLISLDNSSSEKIEKLMLGQCIETYIKDSNIKEVAKRATWLGNDETHYVRKWEDKDVKDLIQLIDLTLYWIESSVLTKELIADMR